MIASIDTEILRKFSRNLRIKCHNFSHIFFIIPSRINNFTHPSFFLRIIHIGQRNRNTCADCNMVKTCFPLFLLGTCPFRGDQHHQLRVFFKKITHELHHTWTWFTFMLRTTVNTYPAHCTNKWPKWQFHIAVFNSDTDMHT